MLLNPRALADSMKPVLLTFIISPRINLAMLTQEVIPMIMPKVRKLGSTMATIVKIRKYPGIEENISLNFKSMKSTGITT